MTVVTLEKAQADLADLLRRAEAGEEIVIARGERPSVRLTVVETRAADEARPRREAGLLRGQFTVPDSFFDPLPDEELRLWEDGPVEPANKTR